MTREFLIGCVQKSSRKSDYLAEQILTVQSNEQQVITTAEELEGFYAVRAMLREIVTSKRIVMRDAQSYCAILLDDNNRKPICRLRFNNAQKFRLGLFNENKEEEVVNLESIDDIFNYADRMKATILSYGLGIDSTKE